MARLAGRAPGRAALEWWGWERLFWHGKKSLPQAAAETVEKPRPRVSGRSRTDK